jgi:peroxiredoxin
MIELGQLEAQHQEFEKRNARVVVISLEDQEAAQITQEQFPHLTVVTDADRGLSEALEVIHAQSHPEGGDTSAPTTFLVDGRGSVRWMHRPDRFTSRLTPEQVLAALDEHVLGG